jgi:hypothetical protein
MCRRRVVKGERKTDCRNAEVCRPTAQRPWNMVPAIILPAFSPSFPFASNSRSAEKRDSQPSNQAPLLTHHFTQRSSANNPPINPPLPSTWNLVGASDSMTLFKCQLLREDKSVSFVEIESNRKTLRMCSPWIERPFGNDTHNVQHPGLAGSLVMNGHN